MIIRLLFISSSILCGTTQIEEPVGYPENNEYIEEEAPAIWIGPGLYYGIWFDNEEDYGDWQRNHWHDHHHDHGSGGHHDHGGGEHHHGGGGGHHGGGGHR
jgi:hypothetical protein